MRYSVRKFIVGLTVMAMSFQPAAAWHGGCGGCGTYYDYHSGGCGYETVVYDDGGCGDPCGGCDPCDGVVVDEPAPAPPAEALPPAGTRPMPTAPPQQLGPVERPAEIAPPPIELAPPAEEPAEEPDSLFNGTEEAAPPAETPAPATEPPAEETNALFGEPAEPAPPAESEPTEQPAEEPLDLFGEPAETEPEMPAEEQPAEEPAEEEAPAEEMPAEEDDDIFGASRSILREPGGLASQELRVWVDNTGNYSCRGRLVRFLDGQVRLLKDTGRTTTVPLYRLSTSDLEFVHRQASAQQADGFQTAQSPIAMPGLAN